MRRHRFATFQAPPLSGSTLGLIAADCVAVRCRNGGGNRSVDADRTSARFALMDCGCRGGNGPEAKVRRGGDRQPKATPVKHSVPKIPCICIGHANVRIGGEVSRRDIVEMVRARQCSSVA